MTQRLSLLAMLTLSLLLSACGGGSSNNDPRASISLVSPASSPMALKQAMDITLSAVNSRAGDGTSLSYTWALEAKPEQSQASLNSTNSLETTFEADREGDYTLSLKVNNGTVDSPLVRYTFTAAPYKPVAVSEETLNVAIGTATIGLDGTKSKLPAGMTGDLSYRWTLTSSPSNSNSLLLNPNTSEPTLTLDLEGEYIAELVVTFDGVESDPAQTKVTVFQGNAQPVAKASFSSAAMAGEQPIMGTKVALDASASTDADGDDLQYRWRIYEAPLTPFPVINNATSANADFTPTIAGDYELKLFVYDGQRQSKEIDVVVKVVADPNSEVNLPPVVELQALGYYPSASIGEQELGRRPEFIFKGYDPEGAALSIVRAELIEKPAGSAAELIEIGSWKPLGRKIHKTKFDTEGTYRVRMTISDGVNEVTKEASMIGKVGGINNQPSVWSVDADSRAVLVGSKLLFEADARDKDGDPLTYEWTLVDKPDGSSASVQPVQHPEKNDLSRAEVLTDVPGVYRVSVIAKDNENLYAKAAKSEYGYAKVKNEAPQISAVVWKRNWGGLAPGESFFQLLPCMSLLHRPVIVDPDGDETFYRSELISKPEGGDFTDASNAAADCPNARGQVFSKPGTYTFRYYASDALLDAPNYDFVVKVDAIENAKGLRLKSVNSDNKDLWRPLPYENIPTNQYVFRPSRNPIAASAINWVLTAEDADYTIENVQVRHINGGLASLTPSFSDLSEGTVIKQGEQLAFKTEFPAVACKRTDSGKEGFHFSFNIKELPEITFVYEDWVGPSSWGSTWPNCGDES